MHVELTINDSPRALFVDESESLATALRRAGHTEVLCGCDGGTCGVSKVFVDDEVRMACGMDALEADGSTIRTVQSLGTQGALHPIQQAFVDHHAVQCGFCIPGMIIEAAALLAENPDPSPETVRAAIDDTLCRCTGYQKPVRAILDAAERLRTQPEAADGVIADE